MLESVRCPSCSSRYGLRLQRVKAGIRRARCFRCRSIFGIESEVLRLLASAPVSPAPESAVVLPDLSVPPPVPAEAPPVPEPAPVELADMTDLDLSIEPEAVLDLDAEEAGEEAPLPPLTDAADLETSAPFEAGPSNAPPSLTLGDLETADEEMLEKTLVVEPVDEPQDIRATLPDAGGSYASAKDAISKLLGDAPRPEVPERRHTGNTMDVEAALDALDSTLGGTTTARDLAPKDLAPKDLGVKDLAKDMATKDLGTKPVQAPAQFRIPIPEPPVAKPMNSTIKLTHEELMAAMAAASNPPPVPVAPPPPKAVTPVPPPVTPVHVPDPLDQNLYKVQLPKETQNNVSLEVLTNWIEQGRVQEFHMVARQQSEHWIEAGKVPALRMIFDRMKRAQSPLVQQAQAMVPPPTEAVPVKKGIFGGLFGRG